MWQSVAWLFGLLLWLFGPTNAEIRPTSSLEHLTQEHGLSNNAVTCILQDRRGFLWIGTEDGLNRYDGFTFKVYRHQSGNASSLLGNFVRSLYESPDGTLWVGLGRAGFCRYDRQTDAFDCYEIKPPNSEVRAHTFQFYEDRQGILWICTDAGLGRLDRRQNDFKLYDLKAQGFPASSVFSVCEDRAGQLWVGSASGLLRFDATSEKATLVLPAIHSPSSVENFLGWTIYGVTPEGWLRLNLERVGLALFDPVREHIIEQFDFTGRPLGILPTTLPSEAPGIAVLRWEEQRIWMRRPDGVTYNLHLPSRTVQNFYRDPKRPDGFGAQSVNCIFQDRSGVLWFGDGVAGIVKFSPTRNRFERYQSRPLDETSLSNNYVRGVFEDRLGRVWVATQFGGLNCLDRKTGQVKRYRTGPSDPTGLRSDQVWSVVEDHQGILWVGTAEGLQRFDQKRGRFYPVPPFPNRIRVNVIYEDPHQRLWIGSSDGLYEISPDRQTVYDHTPAVRAEVQALYTSPQDGCLWIGLPNRAIRYNPAQKTYRAYPVNSRPEYGEPYVTHFTEEPDGTLWMVTKGAGLCRFDPARETFVHILEKDGLPHNNCYAMFRDTKGIFWLSSDAGISSFDPIKRTFRTYTTADGLQGREFNRFSAFRNARGEIFFGGTNGLNVFHPDNLTDNSMPPPVAITELKVNGVARPAVEGMRLVLAHDQNALDIGYVGLDFHVPENNRYRYRLEGFDREWREVGARREANYTNLPPGQYRFWVMAANHDGVWSAGQLLFQMEVHPPWWQTWPAYVGLVITGGLVLYSGVRLRLRRLIIQNRKLESKVAERTLEITYKNRELEARNLEIEAQRRNLLESLTYAQTIQQAMLPTPAMLTAALGEYFVLWKPKDIVSGDFYWLHRLESKVILVVADCTGHGVPGAFMSMIGNDLLGQIVAEHNEQQPARILEELHHRVQRVLKQDGEKPLPDGMDAAVCAFDHQFGTVMFAGARRSLYVVSDGALTEIKGDRHAIGGSGRERQPRVFTDHTVTVPPGAMLYFTTDGFADQPDGRGKKFGTRRLQALLVEVAGLPLVEQQRRLEAELSAHMGEELQRDDITIVGVRWCPPTTNGRLSTAAYSPGSPLNNKPTG